MAENKFTGEIIDFDFKGLGMTKLNGSPVFLNGGVIGDEVEFIISKKKKNFSQGEILKILEKIRCKRLTNVRVWCNIKISKQKE